MRRTKTRAVDLADELQVLQQAVEAMRHIAEQLVNEPDQWTIRTSPRSLQALAALVSARLSLVTQACRDVSDPAVLMAPHNEGIPPQEGAVWLRPWSDNRKGGHE